MKGNQLANNFDKPFTMDNNFFICTNKQCTPDKFGKNIIPIPENNDEQLTCPNCGQKFKITENKSVLTVFEDKPLLIESLKDAVEQMDSITNLDLYINTLHLKGINDSENFEKILSYKYCFIENLIIEDVNLSTSCFPIVFDDCKFMNVTINNCRIEKVYKKDYWGPHLYFGINFNNCKIFGKTILENYTGDLMLRSCDFDEAVTISNCKLGKFNLINSKKKIEVELVNSTIEHKTELIDFFESEEMAVVKPRGMKKVEELLVDDSTPGEIIIDNLYISNLVFPEKEIFEHPVKITNCIIEEMRMGVGCFNQQVEFNNCQFIHSVNISETIFKKLLGFEANNFYADFTLNEVTLENDLHLSYSKFAGNLNIHHTAIAGYVTMHLSSVAGKTDFTHSNLEQNVTLGNNLFNEVVFNTTTVVKDCFFFSFTFHNSFSSKYSVYDTISVSKCYFGAGFVLSNDRIGEDLLFNNNYLINKFSATFIEIKKDVIFSHNVLKNRVDFLLSTLSSFYVFSNSFFDVFQQNGCHSSNNARIENNLSYKDFIFYQSTFADQSYENNVFFEKLDFDDFDGDDLLLESNQITTLSLENVVCGKFLSKDILFTKVEINELICNKQFVFDDCEMKDETTISSSRFMRSVSIKDSFIKNSLTLSQNKIGNSVLIENTNFYYEGKQTANLVMNENDIGSSVQLRRNSYYGKVEVVNNNIAHKLILKYSRVNATEENSKQALLSSFEKGIWIRFNNTNNIELKYLTCNSPVYCDSNLVTGRLELGGNKMETSFNKAISVSNNRARVFKIEECKFEGDACYFNNHVEGGFSVENSSFAIICDISGSYFGGSAQFANTVLSSTLIMDNTFFDKRFDFYNTYPESVSFRSSTLKGFSMPNGWQMMGGKLCMQGGGNHPVLVDERILAGKKLNAPMTFQMLKAMLLEDPKILNDLRKNWREIKKNYPITEETLKDAPDELISLLYYRSIVDQMIKEEFSTLFYNFYEDFELDELIPAATDLSLKLQQENIGSPIIESLTAFGSVFSRLVSAFGEIVIDNKAKTKLRPLLFERLQDQYLVIKETYGESGELGDEDRAYYRWMHYKSAFENSIAKWYQKPHKLFKWVMFEKVFGWGVDLFRIFSSTILLVILFSGIYWVSGQIYPELSILWDDVNTTIAQLSYGNLLLLTFQTTFAAFMGDWTPAGLGLMKVVMTFNAIMGVLLVAFLIGAYGRKMLR